PARSAVPLQDALPICTSRGRVDSPDGAEEIAGPDGSGDDPELHRLAARMDPGDDRVPAGIDPGDDIIAVVANPEGAVEEDSAARDRKSTRLNPSHEWI